MNVRINLIKSFWFTTSLMVLTCIFSVNTIKAETPELSWPAETNVTKPWVFWHWMGNAVDTTNIGLQLNEINKGNIGGVLNIQLLDCADPKAVKIPFLSAKWVDVMKYTIHKTRSLGMDIDMCATTGWELGGPWIKSVDAASKKNNATFTLSAGGKLTSRIGTYRSSIHAVMGFSTDGLKQDLISYVDGSCNLNWTAPADHGSWTIYVMGISRGSCNVRVPTPDANGWVVDYLNPSAVKRHLDKFSTAFANFSPGEWPRAWFDDSWEADMDWTDNGLAEFQKRRGYDLRYFLPELNGKGTADNNARVKRDYMLTVSDMMIDGFFKGSTDWGKSHNSLLSCEAIAHPGNTVDMSAASDIPVADVGGGADWWLPGGQFATTGDFFDRIKSPVSAAHIMGKPLIASETMSCWGPTTTCSSTFEVSLKDIKQKIDLDLIGGINHSMFHSISYTPKEAQWPGYMFSAETQCGPFNPYWSHFTELNKYISRCQSFLQTGKPDVDVLFYYPCDDMFMHGNADYLYLSTIAKQLYENGFDLDYVTDKMLLNPEVVSVSNKKLVSPGSTHKAIVVANCTYMEDTTMQRMFNLAKDGASVVFVGDFPTDVPGLFNLTERRAKLKSLISSFNASKVTEGNISRMNIGSGQILKGSMLKELMASVSIAREKMVDYGLRYIRREDALGWIYFIANPPGNAKVDAWIPLGVTGNSAAFFNPMNEKVGMAGYSKSKVCLQLEPSESIIVRVFKNTVSGPSWVYQSSKELATPITGTWKVEFLSGGETLPTTENVSTLSSWTTWTSSPQYKVLRYFSGVAKYSISFDKPDMAADEWMIDLGDVKNSAKVTLNGTYLGMVCGAPNYRINTNGLLKPTGNILEVEVANLAKNRVAYLDINGISWRFDAGPQWQTAPMITSSFVPLKSGLLGPVKLVPSNDVKPDSIPLSQIAITADNGYELYLNGSLIGTGSNWGGAQRYTLPLVSGKNVIGVKGKNDANTSGGVLASIFSNDSCIAVTNTSWKVSATGPTNWNKVDYNDVNWTKATDYGALGVAPWGSSIAGMPTEPVPHWIWLGSMNNATAFFRLTIMNDLITSHKAVSMTPKNLFQFEVAGTDQMLCVDLSGISLIRIFDLNGRIIRNIEVPSDSKITTWDRCYGSGAMVQKGTYLVQFNTKKETKTMKMSLM